MINHFLSVIICTYNREEYIGKTLMHFNNQSANENLFEIVIVDNKSNDKTADICKEFINSNPNIDVKYYLEQNQGLSYARNTGIAKSKGDLIAFIDDDAFVNHNYIEEVIRFFKENQDINSIGGRIYPEYEKGEPAWMSKYLWPLVAALDNGDKVKPFKGRKFPLGANMAFRAEIFEKYDHFNVELGRRGTVLEAGEEKDLFFRMRKNGEKIFYVPSVAVKHIIPEKRTHLDYIKKQALGIGKSERVRLKKYGFGMKLNRAIEEVIKIFGTIALSTIFIFRKKISAAVILIKFRFWVIKGLVVK
jgi:glucosyl-dolichyl phosphate glucuronosyltransferase